MKPDDKAALPQEKQSTLELRAPGWGYKLSFLIGGIIFSIATYMAGTMLYELELALVERTVLSWGLLGRTLVDVSKNTFSRSRPGWWAQQVFRLGWDTYF